MLDIPFTLFNITGTTSILTSYPTLASATDDEDKASKTHCNNDTGARTHLQRWTRGTWVCISGMGVGIFNCGNLYTSEFSTVRSPQTQVAGSWQI